MHKEEKERVVQELTDRLRTTETLIVTDYRGLTNAELDGLRGELLKHGARFSVVKNTLTRRAAEAAGADALLALLEGPSAIAFLETDGDPVAVAKAIGDATRTTRILSVRGGLLEGKTMDAAEVERLAKLPPADVLRSQVLGAITAPLTTIVGLFTAPLQNLVGLIDARIEQLEAGGDTSGATATEAEAASVDDAPAADAATEPEASAEAEPSTEGTSSEEDAQAADSGEEE